MYELHSVRTAFVYDTLIAMHYRETIKKENGSIQLIYLLY